MRGQKITKLELKRQLMPQLQLAAKFLIGIMAFYIFFWLVISFLDLYALKLFTALAGNGLLNLFGVPAQIVAGIEPMILIDSVAAQITNLCAGDLEIALLMAIILATWDRSIRKKLFGCAFGLITILVINPLRVFAVLAVGYYTSWEWADFTHDVLFRLTLLVVIVVYYFLWYVKYDDIARIKNRLRLKIK